MQENGRESEREKENKYMKNEKYAAVRNVEKNIIKRELKITFDILVAKKEEFQLTIGKGILLKTEEELPY